jgi:hypothetical protein
VPRSAGRSRARRRAALAFLVLPVALALLASGSTALAADDQLAADPAAEAKSFRDRLGYAFATGFGYGFQMRQRTEGTDLPDVRMLLFMPHVSYEIFDLSAHRHWYSGRFDLVIEPEIAINFEPTGTGVGGGITGGFRYALRPDRRWSPYAIGLAGFGGIDYDLTAQDDGFAFWLQFGLGVKRRLGPVALTGDVRLYHISNAGTHPPNAGIDMIAFTLGLETP